MQNPNRLLIFDEDIDSQSQTSGALKILSVRSLFVARGYPIDVFPLPEDCGDQLSILLPFNGKIPSTNNLERIRLLKLRYLFLNVPVTDFGAFTRAPSSSSVSTAGKLFWMPEAVPSAFIFMIAAVRNEVEASYIIPFGDGRMGEHASGIVFVGENRKIYLSLFYSLPSPEFYDHKIAKPIAVMSADTITPVATSDQGLDFVLYSVFDSVIAERRSLTEALDVGILRALWEPSKSSPSVAPATSSPSPFLPGAKHPRVDVGPPLSQAQSLPGIRPPPQRGLKQEPPLIPGGIKRFRLDDQEDEALEEDNVNGIGDLVLAPGFSLPSAARPEILFPDIPTARMVSVSSGYVDPASDMLFQPHFLSPSVYFPKKSELKPTDTAASLLSSRIIPPGSKRLDWSKFRISEVNNDLMEARYRAGYSDVPFLVPASVQGLGPDVQQLVDLLMKTVNRSLMLLTQEVAGDRLAVVLTASDIIATCADAANKTISAAHSRNPDPFVRAAAVLTNSFSAPPTSEAKLLKNFVLASKEMGVNVDPWFFRNIEGVSPSPSSPASIQSPVSSPGKTAFSSSAIQECNGNNNTSYFPGASRTLSDGFRYRDSPQFSSPSISHSSRGADYDPYSSDPSAPLLPFPHQSPVGFKGRRRGRRFPRSPQRGNPQGKNRTGGRTTPTSGGPASHQ